MYFSVSVKELWEKSGKTLRTVPIILIAVCILLLILVWLGGVGGKIPKTKDPVQEKPLRVQLIENILQMTINVDKNM